jgi:hypothetical protein
MKMRIGILLQLDVTSLINWMVMCGGQCARLVDVDRISCMTVRLHVEHIVLWDCQFGIGR